MERIPVSMIRSFTTTRIADVTTPKVDDDWYEDSANIAALLRWLNERGEIVDIDEAIYVVSKPWKWNDEYQQMLKERT